MLPLDLDGMALRSLRALCGTDCAARIVWSRWCDRGSSASRARWQSTDATIADGSWVR